MKRILAIILTAALIILSLASCGSGRIVKPITAGSAFTVMGDDTKSLRVDGIGKLEDGFFTDTDYYVSDEGVPYNIVNLLGKTVATVKLAKKSETYNPEIFEFNLDTYDTAGITITKDMDYVHIYSSDPSTVHYLTIVVDYERTKPCDIKFENANISTNGYTSIITNYSRQDLNIELVGSNCFDTGTAPDIRIYQEMLEEYNRKKDVMAALYPVFYSTYYFEKRAVKVYLDTLTGKGTFEENFFSATDDMISILESGLAGLEGFMNNKKGTDGIDGAPAISSLGSIYLYGQGSLTAIGGNGGDGTDASSGFVGANNVRGGNGGCGGCGVIAYTIIENAEGTVIFRGGKGGSGGEGAGREPTPGNSGASGKGHDGTFYCKIGR